MSQLASVSSLSNVSQIQEHLFLGNLNDACNERLLRAINIKHVLTFLCEDFYQDLTKYDGINYKVIHIDDDEISNIMQYFEECYQFLDNAISKKENVLVHCLMGVSRSATSVRQISVLPLVLRFSS